MKSNISANTNDSDNIANYLAQQLQITTDSISSIKFCIPYATKFEISKLENQIENNELDDKPYYLLGNVFAEIAKTAKESGEDWGSVRHVLEKALERFSQAIDLTYSKNRLYLTARIQIHVALKDYDKAVKDILTISKLRNTDGVITFLDIAGVTNDVAELNNIKITIDELSKSSKIPSELGVALKECVKGSQHLVVQRLDDYKCRSEDMRPTISNFKLVVYKFLQKSVYDKDQLKTKLSELGINVEKLDEVIDKMTPLSPILAREQEEHEQRQQESLELLIKDILGEFNTQEPQSIDLKVNALADLITAEYGQTSVAVIAVDSSVKAEESIINADNHDDHVGDAEIAAHVKSIEVQQPSRSSYLAPFRYIAKAVSGMISSVTKTSSPSAPQLSESGLSDLGLSELESCESQHIELSEIESRDGVIGPIGESPCQLNLT